MIFNNQIPRIPKIPFSNSKVLNFMLTSSTFFDDEAGRCGGATPHQLSHYSAPNGSITTPSILRGGRHG
ncbi:hypothetical protein HanIR_Chr08g0343311 [Helianthus annuus]|nr:hypothetical protein HanIR_Chr08g0343311 [Helianthus annuus]